MKKSLQSNIAIINVLLCFAAACTFNNSIEEKDCSNTHNYTIMETLPEEKNCFDFIDATIISIDSIPKHNLIKSSKNNLCNLLENMFELNLLECDFLCESNSDKNTIVNAKACINEEIIFVVGVFINGDFHFKKLYNAKSNAIISCIQNKDYYIFYGEFINLKNTKIFYEFSYYFKTKSILVTKPDYYFFLE